MGAQLLKNQKRKNLSNQMILKWNTLAFGWLVNAMISLPRELINSGDGRPVGHDLSIILIFDSFVGNERKFHFETKEQIVH